MQTLSAAPFQTYGRFRQVRSKPANGCYGGGTPPYQCRVDQARTCIPFARAAGLVERNRKGSC